MWSPPFRLTTLGRSAALVVGEFVFNVGFWIAAALLFRPHASGDSKDILSLAVLSWTLGLRHALDADHISAIDNATRGLINLGQLPVTCGLFFSLGHSTVVLLFIIAIAISSDVYEKMGGFGDVGGIIGAAVSGSFLFIIGVVNSVILYKIIRRKYRQRNGEPDTDVHEHSTILMRILKPVTRVVDRPWKMYPVGLLFGLGFDTASSIALLALSALAKRDANGKGISAVSIIILPLLFTAGMTLVDSLDSILMLYSYAGFTEQGWALVQWKKTSRHIGDPTADQSEETEALPAEPSSSTKNGPTEQDTSQLVVVPITDEHDTKDQERAMKLKNNSMSNLSIILTLLSILLAFTISLITIMGLIGEQCKKCKEAAEAEDGKGGGLAGRWWRAWAKAGDASGYIGAGIIGGVILIVLMAYLGRYLVKKRVGHQQPIVLA